MLTILNDIHIGVIRGSGTTPASQWALRKYLLDSFKEKLPREGDLMVLGDLFDTGNVPVLDVLSTYEILAGWLTDGYGQLFLVAGNHDLCKSSNVLSSFQFLGKLLHRHRPARVHTVETPTLTTWGYIIPHLENQEALDSAVKAVPMCDTVFMHCNYANMFAAQSDQSLNLSEHQALNLPCRHIILGHEHAPRSKDKVLIPGNQIPSSVSDCLGRSVYRSLSISEAGAISGNTYSSRGLYEELDWREAKETSAKFVRVVGTADATESTSVVNAVAKLRQVSNAFVISNAVQIATDDGTEAFEQSLEDIQGFSIWRALEETLPEADILKLKELDHA
jgi:DNA repair exonuclease SbcCD nuclease subunit